MMYIHSLHTVDKPQLNIRRTKLGFVTEYDFRFTLWVRLSVAIKGRFLDLNWLVKLVLTDRFA